jgi:hypothetical protein
MTTTAAAAAVGAVAGCGWVMLRMAALRPFLRGCVVVDVDDDGWERMRGLGCLVLFVAVAAAAVRYWKGTLRMVVVVEVWSREKLRREGSVWSGWRLWGVFWRMAPLVADWGMRLACLFVWSARVMA